MKGNYNVEKPQIIRNIYAMLQISIQLNNFSGFFQETMFEEIKELQFVAAEAEVIQALDLCVVLMNTGEIAEIMADPEMAFGKF